MALARGYAEGGSGELRIGVFGGLQAVRVYRAERDKDDPKRFRGVLEAHPEYFKITASNSVQLLRSTFENARPMRAGPDPDLTSLLAGLPPTVQHAMAEHVRPTDTVTEVQLDVGRPPVVRFLDGRSTPLRGVTEDLAEAMQCLQALSDSESSFSSNRGTDASDADGDEGSPTASSFLSPRVLNRLFDADNRMGLPCTLHRISTMRTRTGSLSGLTYRVGRHVPGAAAKFKHLLKEVADTMTGKVARDGASQCGSILLVGRPDSGKTTLLRDMARVLADDLGLSVIVVDTNMELGGRPHVGPSPRARRRPPHASRGLNRQEATLIEAVQNHGPQVVVVDEIGTAQEVAAVHSISQCGIAMLGTAHGTDLASLLANPVLLPLLGGVKSVTLGDTKAFSNNSGVKTRLERGGPPAFTSLVEVLGPEKHRVRRNLADAVDTALRVPLTSDTSDNDGDDVEEDEE